MKMTKILFVAAIAMGSFVGGAIAADYYKDLPGVVKPKNYIGVTGGISAEGTGKGAMGVVAGRELTENVTVEAQYDYREGDSNLLTGNVLVGQQIGNIKPYALAGGGYKWTKEKDGSVWLVGAGVKFNVTDKLDLDARYRYVDGVGKGDNRITIGANYKF